jgi:hypothetical protein
LQGLLDGDNTDVSAIRPDQTDFVDPNALVDSKFCSADKILLFRTVNQPLAGFWRTDNTMKASESSTK